MSSENRTPYKIPFLKIILNGTPGKPETNNHRSLISTIAAGLSVPLVLYLLRLNPLLPALYTLEVYRQISLRNKKSAK